MEDGAVHPIRKKLKNIQKIGKKAAAQAAQALSSPLATPEALSAAARILRARRTATMSAKERSRQASIGGKACWAGTSKEERLIEMKRRARVRKKRRIAARKERVRAGK